MGGQGEVGGVVGGVVGVVPPVQATPLRVNEGGTGLEPVQLPLKPKLTLAPGARFALQLGPVTSTWAALCA